MTWLLENNCKYTYISIVSYIIRIIESESPAHAAHYILSEDVLSSWKQEYKYNTLLARFIVLDHK